LEACFGIIADKGFYSPPPMESGGVYCNWLIDFNKTVWEPSIQQAIWIQLACQDNFAKHGVMVSVIECVSCT
jgi:hypothetical protein